MKLSRERQIFLAFLGLGLVALAADRALLAPSNAVAAGAVTIEALERASAADAVPPAPTKAAAVKPPSGPSFAVRLVAASKSHLTDTSKARDAFTPGSAWGVQIASVPEETQPVMTVETFIQTYRPQLIFRSAGRGIVKVGARQCRVGDSVDGWMLAAIGRKSMTFSSGCTSLQVPLAEGAAGHPPSRAADNGRVPTPSH